MSVWVDSLQEHVRGGIPCVLVTIVSVEGSTPREAGAHMVVGPEGAIDTIGGGSLEQAVIEHATELLESASGEPLLSNRTYNLGKELSQCCGGRVNVQFERHPVHDFQIEVFGAGHVAQELARLLVRLPCKATFHDGRADWLRRLTMISAVDSGLGLIKTAHLGDDIHSCIESMSAGRYFVVMTHSHDRDFACVEAILSRGDTRYCGLIASESKASSFKKRLLRKQFTQSEIASLTAPLGKHIKTGDTPMEVAIAAVSDILSLRAEEAREAVEAISCERISMLKSD